MNRISLIASLVILLMSSSKTLAADPDLAKLKANYEAAAERALAPLKTVYEQELRKLVEKQTKAGNLAGALEANNELEALTGKPTQASTPEVKAASAKAAERFFVNKTWTESGGSSFAFKKDGAGIRQYKEAKAAFVWKLTDNGLVEITGEAPGEGRTQTLYFRFVSAIEGYFGGSSADVTRKMTPKR